MGLAADRFSGVISVPLWVTVGLGVLALVGTVGGAWGGQMIAGRNDSRRWQRERDREAQAFWRDKRLDVYSRTLAEVEDVTVALSVFLRFQAVKPWNENLPTDLDNIQDELHTIRMIGSAETIAILVEVEMKVILLLSKAHHPANSRGKGPLSDLHPDFNALMKMVEALGMQFRSDLGVVSGMTLIGGPDATSSKLGGPDATSSPLALLGRRRRGRMP